MLFQPGPFPAPARKSRSQGVASRNDSDSDVGSVPVSGGRLRRVWREFGCVRRRRSKELTMEILLFPNYHHHLLLSASTLRLVCRIAASTLSTGVLFVSRRKHALRDGRSGVKQRMQESKRAATGVVSALM